MHNYNPKMLIHNNFDYARVVKGKQYEDNGINVYIHVRMHVFGFNIKHTKGLFNLGYYIFTPRFKLFRANIEVSILSQINNLNDSTCVFDQLFINNYNLSISILLTLKSLKLRHRLCQTVKI